MFKFSEYFILNFSIILILFSTKSLFSQGFNYVSTINSIDASYNTLDKPQSKVWYHANHWWAVIPVDSYGDGTYIYRLDNNTSWTRTIKIHSSKSARADIKVDSDTTHILLLTGSSTAYLISVEYNSNTNEYEIWSGRNDNTTISLGATESATLDMDSEHRIWVAYDAQTTMNVKYSNYPYENFSSQIALGTGTDTDDICAITAFGGNKIGVLWSDQNDKEFKFKYHLDSDNPQIWSSEETAASGSFNNKGVADDHINFAVNGSTIYAAIKTSYDDGDQTSIGLLVRNSSGSWEPLYKVRNKSGSRPIVLFNEAEDYIYVIYQDDTNGGKIVYKYSSISNISFPSSETLLDPSDTNDYQDVTSTKQNFSDEALILFWKYGTAYEWVGKLCGSSPLPVELSSFIANIVSNKIYLSWRTETEVDNYGFELEYSTDRNNYQKLAFIPGYGNSNSPKMYSYIDENDHLSNIIYYRLKQIDNDGSFEYSDVIQVNTGLITNYELYQNYPNPFNPETKIKFQVPEKVNVIIKVYNSIGAEVAELLNEEKDPGTYEVSFNVDNSNFGVHDLASGVYYYTITAGNFHSAKKMSLIK